MGGYGEEDKEEMRRLNDKLAAYLQRVRSLGTSGGSVVFLDTLRTIEDDVRKLKNMYEAELDKLRKQLNDANKQKNEAVTELEKVKRSNKDLEDWYRAEKDKNGGLLCDINKLKERVAELEKELAMAKSAAHGPQQQVSYLQANLDKEQGKSAELQRALDAEKARNTQLQDKLKNVTGKNEFDGQMKEESCREANNRLAQAKKVILDLEKKNRDLQDQVDALPGLLEQMKKKTQQDIQSFQRDVETTNKRNMESLKRQLEAQNQALEELRANYAKVDRQNMDLMTKLRNMEGQVQDLNNQKANLEDQIREERARGTEQIKALERKLQELQNQLMAKMQELNAGKDVQLSLKAEIETYRVLLEEEEKRLGGPVGGQSGLGRQPSRQSSGMGSSRCSSSRSNLGATGNTTGGAGTKGKPGLSTSRYQPRTEYQYAYNKFSKLPRIDNSGPTVRGNGGLANSHSGNIRSYQMKC